MKSPFPCPWTWDLGMSVLMRANELLMVLACVNWGLEGKFGFICAWKWKWSDIRLSMETRTRNPCSAFNPFKVHTHSSEHTHTHTHTPWTHTRSSGQPFMLQRPRSSWVPCSRAPQLWYWGWRERWTFTHPTYNSCQPETRTHNLWITSLTL